MEHTEVSRCSCCGTSSQVKAQEVPVRACYKDSSPDSLRVGGVGHVCPCRLLHGLLVELVFGKRRGAEWTDPERGGDADFRYGRLRGGRCAGRCR